MSFNERIGFSYKNDDGDYIIMDIEMYSQREETVKLRKDLLAAEEDRAAGRYGVTPDELEDYLDSIINKAENEKA